jgi:hypothetical protein
MIEIIGENMKNIWIILGINPKETFSGSIGYWKNFKVWELTDAEFKSLCEITDEQFERWSEEGAWWRYAEGSVLGTPDVLFRINGDFLMAWEKLDRSDLYEKWSTLSRAEKKKYYDDEDYVELNRPHSYKDILTYLCDEVGVSTERNVCALVTDLAKYNNMSIAELFIRFGGDNNESY